LKISQKISAEIIVVGAGMAGVIAAVVLGQRGHSVILVDPRPSCPALFRAEKLEPDQAQMLHKLGLLEHLKPHARRVREVRCGYNGRLFKIAPIEQYGIYYSDMVNVLRAHIPIGVEQKLGYVEHIQNSNDLQCVRLKSGEELTSRLVVLANGVGTELQASLGLRKGVIRKDQSIAFGFSIARKDGLPFPFDATTYYPTTCTAYIDYLALFVMGRAMRANLFVFRAANDPWVREFMKHPGQILEHALPKLSRLIGEYRIVTKVETGRIELYRMHEELQPGVVLIGDAFQSACPATGKGLSKIGTDVDVLCSECVPEWLATPGMGCDKIAKFYNHARKCAVDKYTLEMADYRRRASTEKSIRWRIHRLRLHLEMQFGRKYTSEPSPTTFSLANGPPDVPVKENEVDENTLVV
jgi:2-polyprenyl-6-methoxyphenol hydroxylase-like FAD-dependent oxidoreductase